MSKAIILSVFFLSAPALAQDAARPADLSDKAAVNEASPPPPPLAQSLAVKPSGFLSLIIDPSFVPAQDFKFHFPSLSLLYGKSFGQISWMFGLHATSFAYGAAGKLQYDFTSDSVRPGAEISLFAGAGRSKPDVCEGADGRSALCGSGDALLAGGASAGFFLKADISRSVSVAGRLGASIKPLTVKSPDLSENMWLFYLGVEMQWRLF